MITGTFALDWLLISASLFNTMLLSWLGMTVLLNAERRTWGVYVMGIGFLAGAAFFFSHTIILAGELSGFGLNINFWWRIGWYPLILAPYAWYLVMLWYTGYWTHPRASLHARHRLWLAISTVVGSALLLVLLFFNPIPTYEQLIALELTALFAGVQPLLLLTYPVFMVGCIVLSIDALRRPAQAVRMMGNLARERSRPWLLGAALVLLAVSLLVVSFIIWMMNSVSAGLRPPVDIAAIALFDLTLVALITFASLLIGQAIVSYEVFTGRALPRRGFFRHWQAAIVLSGGCALLIGWLVAIQLRAIYGLMLMTILIVALFALFGWRSFVERDRLIQYLRPFVSSQQMMQHLLDETSSTKTGATDLFQALCHDVLGTISAQLIPMGYLAPLIGQPLRIPEAQVEHQMGQLQSLLTEAQHLIMLPDADDGGLRWAVPLWNERGMMGALLISDKRDGGLYTQEEIDLARTTCERILDMLASEELAERLMHLERKRLSEHRIMDLRTRRILHDETLPLLHTAALSLGNVAKNTPDAAEAISILTSVHRQIADLIHAIPKLNTMPAQESLAETLRTLIADEFVGEFNHVAWDIQADLPSIQAQIKEIVLAAAREIIRNATIHGRGTQPDRALTLTVTLMADTNDLRLCIADNGVGFDYPNSVSKGGSGGGLQLHSTMLAIIGGYLDIRTGVDGGTNATITLPIKTPSETR